MALNTGYGLADKISGRPELVRKLQFISENFSGLTKDFLIASTSNQAINSGISFPSAQVQYITGEMLDTTYRNLINTKLNATNKYIEGKDNLLFADGKTMESMEVVLLKYKGKITLIDYWASWCAPCRAEIPNLITLKKKYPNRLAVVSISSDTKVEAWLKACREESLEPDNSFLLLNAQKSAIVEKFKISSIPRYLLIAKDGKIISDNAPRPSDPELRKLIEENF